MGLDDKKLEISIEPSSNLRHEKTPVGGASSVPQDESRGLNEMSAEDLNSLKKQVYAYARKNKWKEAESIFNKYGEMVRIPLTDNEDRALHVAVKANSITFVKGLVNLMTPPELEIQNSWGGTAFYHAAISGNSDFVQIMIEKNQNLPLIKSTFDGMLPVHFAAIEGHHKIVQDLCSNTLLQKMDIEDIQNLFFLTIDYDMFDVATKLFEEYPDVLAIATGGENEQTAAEMLLRKRSKKFSTKEGNNNDNGEASSGDGDGLQLFQNIWLQLARQLEWKEILELIGTGSLVSAMDDALESGNVEAVDWLLSKNREQSLPVNSNKQNILHYAVRQRHRRIVSYIFQMYGPFDKIALAVDKHDNNILHLAAYPLDKEKTPSTLSPTTRMTREVKWFEEIRKNAPAKLRKMKNKEGKTPMDVFKVHHKELSNEIKDEVKDSAKVIADSGMLVAALAATVAFAAALTVPGDDKTNPWFTVFILANGAALFASSTSVFFVLTNFPSTKFAEREFVIAPHPSLILVRIFLLISMATLIISFAAASFLIFEHTSKWVPYVVTLMGLYTILFVLLFQFRIYDTFLWSRFYRLPYDQ